MNNTGDKEETLIKSKKRVADHGEVYTPSWLVESMLDLVKQETERIDSRFLEPACGDGNFLAKVLERKLKIVFQRYRKSQEEYEKYAVLGISSIYGIDIIQDNVVACRDRLLKIFEDDYRNIYKDKINPLCIESVEKILSLNIVHGDALSLKSCDKKPKPIIFPEWSLVNTTHFKRRDFSFEELMATLDYNSMPLFSDQNEDVFIPTPVKEHDLVHYLKINDAN